MEQIANREHQSNDSFHRDSPDAWRTALLVEGIIGALRQINHSQKRTACCLLLARIRPKQTTVLAAATETLLSVLPPAKDPHPMTISMYKISVPIFVQFLTSIAPQHAALSRRCAGAVIRCRHPA